MCHHTLPQILTSLGYKILQMFPKNLKIRNQTWGRRNKNIIFKFSFQCQSSPVSLIKSDFIWTIKHCIHKRLEKRECWREKANMHILLNCKYSDLLKAKSNNFSGRESVLETPPWSMNFCCHRTTTGSVLILRVRWIRYPRFRSPMF